jgi:hypothetical protein
MVGVLRTKAGMGAQPVTGPLWQARCGAPAMSALNACSHQDTIFMLRFRLHRCRGVL